VRKKHDPSTIPELAAAILAEGGLLNPLAVIPEKIKGSKGDHGVVAGGRRLAALQYLAEHAAVRADVPVRCRVFDAERGVSVSLVENATQEPMHPADQLEAFKRLVDEGRTAGQIAAAYNLTALTVERRLKLARLAPTRSKWASCRRWPWPTTKTSSGVSGTRCRRTSARRTTSRRC